MKDKDRLILLFNIYVGDIENPKDVNDFLGRTIKAFADYFDESVKCIFTATKDSSKPVVQAVTNFPIEGIELIEKLIDYEESGDEDKKREQKEIVKNFIHEFKQEKKS